MVAIVLDRGDHGLHRLLAKFLGAMLRTLVQQFARVGRFTSRRRAGIDGGGQVMNGKTRHQPTHARPPEPDAVYPTGDLALLSPGVVRDQAVSAARRAPCGPWLHVW